MAKTYIFLHGTFTFVHRSVEGKKFIEVLLPHVGHEHSFRIGPWLGEVDILANQTINLRPVLLDGGNPIDPCLMPIYTDSGSGSVGAAADCGAEQIFAKLQLPLPECVYPYSILPYCADDFLGTQPCPAPALTASNYILQYTPNLGALTSTLSELTGIDDDDEEDQVVHVWSAPTRDFGLSDTHAGHAFDCAVALIKGTDFHLSLQGLDARRKHQGMIDTEPVEKLLEMDRSNTPAGVQIPKLPDAITRYDLLDLPRRTQVLGVLGDYIRDGEDLSQSDLKRILLGEVSFLRQPPGCGISVGVGN